MKAFLGIDYSTWWFIIIGSLITGYAILDGFDFRAGAWHLFLDRKEERRVALDTISPMWGGNEAWLVIGGASILAGFPLMYASLFSTMNAPFMLFLTFIIFRAVPVGFRGKEDSRRWYDNWDLVYGICSTVLPLLLGVVIGSLLQGLPLDNDFEYTGGTLFTFLTPCALLVGLMTVLLITIYGGFYLLLKTHGNLHERIARRINKAYVGFLVLFVAIAVYSLLTPYLTANAAQSPALIVIAVSLLINILSIAIFIKEGDYKKSFIGTILTMIFFILIVALQLHPVFLRNTEVIDHDMTVYSTTTSTKSLEIMLTIAAIGAPSLLIYTYFAYKVFWGEVAIDEYSY